MCRLKYPLFLLLSFCAALVAAASEAPVEGVAVVRDHKPAAAIVLAGGANAGVREAAQLFAATVERSTGAKLPVYVGTAPAEAAAGTLILIGNTAEARARGLSSSELPREGYRIVAEGDRVFVLGNDDVASNSRTFSRPTLWALNRLLEEQLGVRWLWPGHLGTYVPAHADFSVPQMDFSYQPKLEQRRLRIPQTEQTPVVARTDSESIALDDRLRKEVRLWVENHQQGRRDNVQFGHAFTQWWDRYGETHPEYFAQTPDGVSQPFPRASFVKLRLSNPEVIEQIAAEYQAAGAPEFWNVCPNDGGGFDLSPETLAWDIPADQSPEQIWRGRGNMTARYVTFWNRLHERLSQINPDVKLSTYAYHSYKTPPLPEHPLKAKTVIGIVPGYKDEVMWKGWADQPGTDGMYLRPNWGWIGANAPYLPLGYMADFMRMAWENGMAGFDMDSINGYWGSQGINYYLLARMMSRSDMTRDEVVREYSEAFGAGAEKIREYIAYWEVVTEDFSYREEYAMNDPESETGKFAQLLKEGKVDRSFVRSPRYALPYIYPDEVIAPALQILAEAEQAIGDSDAEALQRVQFIRDGLEDLRLTRDVIAVGKYIRTPATREQILMLQERSVKMDAFRRQITPSHAVWSDYSRWIEDRYRLPFRPSVIGLEVPNLDGQ